MARARLCLRCGAEIEKDFYGKYCRACSVIARREAASKPRNTQTTPAKDYHKQCRSGCKWWAQGTGSCDRYLVTRKHMGGGYEAVRARTLKGKCPHYEKGKLDRYEGF